MKQNIIYFISYGFFNYHYPEEPKGFLPGLKIGYTSNWEIRKLYYQRDLLDYEFLSSRPGNEVLEQAIHLWYSDYRLRIRRLTEWFRDYNYIRDTFNIIPDDVFLRYSENLYNPRELNNLYNFGLKYLLKFPEDPFQQDQIWRLAAGSGINLNSISDITAELITKIYEFSEKYLKMDLVNSNEILSRLEEIREDFKIKTEIDEESFLSAKEIIDIPKFENKMKKCCEYYSLSSEHSVFDYLPKEFKYYLDTLGVDNISKVSYARSRIENALKKVIPGINSKLSSDSSLIKSELISILKEGESYSLRYLKNLLKDIKEKYGFPFTPKAVLLKNYCEGEETHVIDQEINKRSQGYKIISWKN